MRRAMLMRYMREVTTSRWNDGEKDRRAQVDGATPRRGCGGYTRLYRASASTCDTSNLVFMWAMVLPASDSTKSGVASSVGTEVRFLWPPIWLMYDKKLWIVEGG